jgi:hypothetical protein
MITAEKNQTDSLFSGLVIGLLVGVRSDGHALVILPGNRSEQGMLCRSTTQLGEIDIGTQVVVMWTQGESASPVIIGKLLADCKSTPTTAGSGQPVTALSVVTDATTTTIRTEKTLTIIVGKSSITLAPDGKITLHGEQILSRAKKANKVKGGSVEIN